MSETNDFRDGIAWTLGRLLRADGAPPQPIKASDIHPGSPGFTNAGTYRGVAIDFGFKGCPVATWHPTAVPVDAPESFTILPDRFDAALDQEVRAILDTMNHSFLGVPCARRAVESVTQHEPRRAGRSEEKRSFDPLRINFAAMP